jgi:hypothetical protein
MIFEQIIKILETKYILGLDAMRWLDIICYRYYKNIHIVWLVADIDYKY